MKELLAGAAEYNARFAATYQASLARYEAAGARPGALMLTCTDNRTLPHAFTRSGPEGLFLLRNVGNMFPPFDPIRGLYSDEAEAAAVEYALAEKRIRNFIICGHGDCGCMKAALAGRVPDEMPHLRYWVRHAQPALDDLKAGRALDPTLDLPSQLAQLNTLRQLQNALTHDPVARRVEAGTLKLHAWFFDLSTCVVSAYDQAANRFLPITAPPEPDPPGGKQEGVQRLATALTGLAIAHDPDPS